jgi:hypothetical protein
MVLEYAAGGELFDLIAKRERVSNKNYFKISVDRGRSQENFLTNYLQY